MKTILISVLFVTIIYNTSYSQQIKGKYSLNELLSLQNQKYGVKDCSECIETEVWTNVRTTTNYYDGPGNSQYSNETSDNSDTGYYKNTCKFPIYVVGIKRIDENTFTDATIKILPNETYVSGIKSDTYDPHIYRIDPKIIAKKLSDYEIQFIRISRKG